MGSAERTLDAEVREEMLELEDVHMPGSQRAAVDIAAAERLRESGVLTEDDMRLCQSALCCFLIFHTCFHIFLASGVRLCFRALALICRISLLSWHIKVFFLPL